MLQLLCCETEGLKLRNTEEMVQPELLLIFGCYQCSLLKFWILWWVPKGLTLGILARAKLQAHVTHIYL